jgi:hypothetical protein
MADTLILYKERDSTTPLYDDNPQALDHSLNYSLPIHSGIVGRYRLKDLRYHLPVQKSCIKNPLGLSAVL